VATVSGGSRQRSAAARSSASAPVLVTASTVRWRATVAITNGRNAAGPLIVSDGVPIESSALVSAGSGRAASSRPDRLMKDPLAKAGSAVVPDPHADGGCVQPTWRLEVAARHPTSTGAQLDLARGQRPLAHFGSRNLTVQGPPQHRARRVHRVGQVQHLNIQSREILLEPATLRGTSPVITFDDQVKPQPLPHLQFAGQVLDDSIVDVPDAPDYLKTLR